MSAESTTAFLESPRLEEYINSLDESRRTADSWTPAMIKSNNNNKSARFVRSVKAKQLVEEIDRLRRICTTLKDLTEKSGTTTTTTTKTKSTTTTYVLAAGVNVTVDQDGYHSFDSRYTIGVGEFMFFRLADALICEQTADPFTLDEWARYVGSLLKPIVLKWGKERIHCFIEICVCAIYVRDSVVVRAWIYFC